MGNGSTSGVSRKDDKSYSMKHRGHGEWESCTKMEKKWAKELELENLFEKEVKLYKKYLKKYPEMRIILRKELGPKAASFKTMTNLALVEDLSETTVKIDNLTENLNDIHSILREYVYKEKRRIVCYYLATTEGMGKTCAELYQTAIDKFGQVNQENIKTPNRGQLLQESLLDFLIDLCERSCLVSNQMEEYGTLETVIKSTASLDPESLDDAMIDWAIKRFALIYQCAKAGVSQQFFKSQKVVEIIKPFANAARGHRSDEAHMFVATLSEDGGADMLTNDDEKFIQMFLKAFKEAVECPNKLSSDGFSVEEMASGLKKFASIDRNKKFIINNGALPLIVKLANEGDEEQKQAALELMWTLSYDEENKKVIMEDSSATECLKKWSACQYDKVRKAAIGTMWSLHRKKPEKNDNGKTEAVTEKQEEHVPHVMISYQWDVQKLMIKVRDELKRRGYRIWMDVDEMGGSTLEAMASAVEGAAVVLICMSTKYKDSPNCRAEGEYAFQINKDIVPLLVEKDYKASGWLGPVIGAKYYIDLTAKVQSFDNYINSLVRELGNRGRTGVIESLEQVEEGPGDLDRISSGEDDDNGAYKISKWTPEQVQSWAEDHQISSQGVLSLTGEDLNTLLELRSEAPEYFYNHVDKNLGISTIRELGKLRKALDNLKK